MRLSTAVRISALAVLSGCADRVTAPKLVYGDRLASAAGAQLFAAVQGRQERGFEDEILRAESTIPGLGGISLGVDGRAVVYLKDLTQRSVALAELGRLASTLRVDRRFRNILGDAGSVNVRKGRFTFSEVVAMEQIVAQHLRVPGFLSIDADESLNRVRVAISRDADESAFHFAIAQLGLPDSAVVLERRDRASAASTLRDSIRSTGGGLQITNAGGAKGTLGYNVTTQFYNETGFLTAGHCQSSAQGAGYTGDTIYQNTQTSSKAIGIVSINPAWTRTDSDCMSHPLCSAADVMFVTMLDSTHNWAKRVARTMGYGVNNAAGSITFYSTPWFTGMSTVPFVYVGAPAHKTGRTTGWTAGTIGSTCDNPYIDGHVTLCAIRVDSAAAGEGDSGAPVFYPPYQTDPFYVMGTLFASWLNTTNSEGYQICNANCYYYYSPIDQIESHLNRYINY